MVGADRVGHANVRLNVVFIRVRPDGFRHVIDLLFVAVTSTNLDAPGRSVVVGPVGPLSPRSPFVLYRFQNPLGLLRPLPAGVLQGFVGRGRKAREQRGRRVDEQIVGSPADEDLDAIGGRAIDRLSARLRHEHVDDPDRRGAAGTGRGNRLRDERETGLVVDRHPATRGVDLDRTGAGARVDNLSGERQPRARADIGVVENQLARLGIEGEPELAVTIRIRAQLFGRNPVQRIRLPSGEELVSIGPKFVFERTRHHDRLIWRRRLADDEVSVDVDRVREDGDLLGGDRRGLRGSERGSEASRDRLTITAIQGLPGLIRRFRRERPDGDLLRRRPAHVRGTLHVEHRRSVGHPHLEALGTDRAEHAERAAGVRDRDAAARIDGGPGEKHRGPVAAAVERRRVARVDRDARSVGVLREVPARGDRRRTAATAAGFLECDLAGRSIGDRQRVEDKVVGARVGDGNVGLVGVERRGAVERVGDDRNAAAAYGERADPDSLSGGRHGGREQRGRVAEVRRDERLRIERGIEGGRDRQAVDDGRRARERAGAEVCRDRERHIGLVPGRETAGQHDPGGVRQLRDVGGALDVLVAHDRVPDRLEVVVGHLAVTHHGRPARFGGDPHVAAATDGRTGAEGDGARVGKRRLGDHVDEGDGAAGLPVDDRRDADPRGGDGRGIRADRDGHRVVGGQLGIRAERDLLVHGDAGRGVEVDARRQATRLAEDLVGRLDIRGRADGEVAAGRERDVIAHIDVRGHGGCGS